MNSKDVLRKLYKLKKTMPDLMIKELSYGLFSTVYVVAIETVCSTDRINDFILKFFGNKRNSAKKNININKDLQQFVPGINKKTIKDFDNLLYFLFSGFTVIIYDETFLAFETRASIDRGVNPPTSEPVTRGPKDSFNENYNTNLGLIRKRVKSKDLIIEELTVGRESKSKVAVIYMGNICDINVANKIIKDIEDIDIDGVFDINYIKELIRNQNYTFFPTMIVSEKPDDTCKNILDGKIIVMMENSPEVLLLPTFFINFFQNNEDYYRKPFFVSFVRIIRILSFFISIILPALFLSLLTYDQEILPTSLIINFAAQRNNIPFPTIVELCILLFVFEIIYEGDARTPSSSSTSLSILGALVLGDAAVNAGLISPIVVIVVAITSISSLLSVFQEMQTPIRFWRYMLLIFVLFFGIVGLGVGCTLLLINLCTIESYGKSYLSPFVPFDLQAQGNAVIRRNLRHLKFRKSYLSNNHVRKG